MHQFGKLYRLASQDQSSGYPGPRHGSFGLFRDENRSTSSLTDSARQNLLFYYVRPTFSRPGVKMAPNAYSRLRRSKPAILPIKTTGVFAKTLGFPFITGLDKRVHDTQVFLLQLVECIGHPGSGGVLLEPLQSAHAF